MGRRRWPVALLVALWLGQLGAWAAGRSKVNPRIVAAPQGESRAAPSAPRAGSLLPGTRPWSRVGLFLFLLCPRRGFWLSLNAC